MTKYVFITGGVLSGIGKGLVTCSVGKMLQVRGFKVSAIKCDPYLNVDAGTMNPYIHGEVFVLDDGYEADMDLGTYERFLGVELSGLNNVTSGQLYQHVIRREREGGFLGRCVQIIPHITDEVKRRIRLVAEKSRADVVLVECGGTVGDIESLPFLEAFRQMRQEEKRGDTLLIHVTLVPVLDAVGEPKTKPTQHSVKELRSIGIQPDIILCRSEVNLDRDLKAKIALFCDVDKDAVFSAVDVQSIYEVPLRFYHEGVDQKIAILLKLPAKNAELDAWKELNRRVAEPKGRVRIGIVGKYVDLKEAYKSLHEALIHGGVANEVAVDLEYVNSEEVTAKNYEKKLKNLDGILVPGGFGSRGIEGKILSIKYARENKIPFFGICLGMQCAVIEFARNVLGLEGANSEEFDKLTPHPVIYLMTEWYDFRKKRVEKRDADCEKGGTMRLGAYPCKISKDTKAHAAYGETHIEERHRHRYEFNKKYAEMFHEKGLMLSGLSPDEALVEIVELPGHPWFLGCQFHPEFKSNPMRPHPLFRDFITAAKENKRSA